ncbi:diguanylate cyclase domain-containing protein [uncultured Aeromicrobium sp.]|uniref:GGDEF domain-containing protein n=1 Tax=uncultured Aeromicrobium sp. TaxID=337820 RepID=UPI0025DCB2B0|nr:diguanylate cyclase [uncultured Aeromicrobium sp.]
MHAHDVVLGALVGSATTTVVFVVTSVVQAGGRSSRILATSQFVFTATLLLYSSWTQSRTTGLTLVQIVATAGLLIAIAIAWSGIRALHDKSPRLLLALAVPITATTACAVAERHGAPVGVTTLVGGLVVAGFATASLYELQTGSWAQYPHARVLQVFLGVLSVAATALAVFGWREDQALVWGAVGLVPTQIAIATCSAVLQRERGRSWGHRANEVSNPLADLDVLTPASFRFAAQGRLRRLSLVGGHGCMILVSVEDLGALNSAFGRDVGDEAVRKLAETVRAHVPPWAPIGHLGAGNFAVVAPAATPRTAHEVVTAIEEALLTSRTTTVAGVRIGAIYGIADTFTTAPDYAALLEQAISSMAASAKKLTSPHLEQRLGKS